MFADRSLSLAVPRLRMHLVPPLFDDAAFDDAEIEQATMGTVVDLIAHRYAAGTTIARAGRVGLMLVVSDDPKFGVLWSWRTDDEVLARFKNRPAALHWMRQQLAVHAVN